MTVSHANDSYFWVVTNFGEMEPQDGYKTQTAGHADYRHRVHHQRADRLRHLLRRRPLRAAVPRRGPHSVSRNGGYRNEPRCKTHSRRRAARCASGRGRGTGFGSDRLSARRRLILVAAGKAAWEMARAAHERLGGRIDAGVVVTKYDYSRGPLGSLEIYEAGHPVPDENSYRATARALEVVSGLTEADSVLFLLSGGGSALFEQPLIPAGELADITRQLLAAAPTSWRSTRCASASPPSRAAVLRCGACPRMSTPWSSATSSATRWT